MKLIGRSVARVLLSIAVVAGVGLAADVARADEPSHPTSSIKLQLDRHAFETAHGITVTYLRIRNGARSVCGYADRVLLEERVGWEICVAATIRHTVEQIDDARLTEFYRVKSRGAQSPSNMELQADRLP